MNARLQKSLIHSADVRMHLTVNGQILPIAQLGPEFVILRHPTDHLPAMAEVFVSIDGNEKRWPVYLTEGIKTSERRTLISACLPQNVSTAS